MFSAREILLAAQLQVDSGGKASPFVTLKVTVDEEGQASFEAFQVSDQCLEMFTAGALSEHPETPSSCHVDKTFTAFVEAKASPEVDNNFFLCVVPVLHHTSFLKSTFPLLNREGSTHTREALSAHLKQYASEPYALRLSDFQLLLFLTTFLDLKSDLAVIIQSILHEDIPMDSGFQMIIDSVAGIA